jgi:hypothetical protein
MRPWIQSHLRKKKKDAIFFKKGAWGIGRYERVIEGVNMIKVYYAYIEIPQ